MQLVDLQHQRVQARRTCTDRDHRRTGHRQGHRAGQQQRAQRRVRGERRQARPGSGDQTGPRGQPGQPGLLRLRGLRHGPEVAQQERAHAVHPDLGSGGRLGEQAADQLTGPRVLHPGVEGLVAAPGVGQRAPGAGQGHGDQQGQQRRMQHREHARSGDQRDHRVDHPSAVADHVPGGPGAVLGRVQQLVEGVVLDGGQLDVRRPPQVQLGRHPFHLGFQPSGGVDGGGPQQRGDQRHDGHHDEGGGSRAQPLLDVRAGEQLAERVVHGQQAHRLDHAPAGLRRQHHPRGPRVRLPGQPETGRQHAGQPGHHRPEGQREEGVRVLVPAHVVPQRPAEQQPFRRRHHRLGRLPLLPHRDLPDPDGTATIPAVTPGSAGRERTHEGRGGSTVRVSGAVGGCWVACETWRGLGARAGCRSCGTGGNGRLGRHRRQPGRQRLRPGGRNSYAETARDQSGAVPVTRHRARYSGIGGVYGTVPSGRWISRAVPVARAPTA